MSNEFTYPHPDPNVHPWALEGGPSHIRVYPYSAHEWEHFSEGGDPLTDFLEPPIVTEEMNGRFDVVFRYRKGGNNADKLDYLKILICPVPIYWEEMFYIAEMEEDLDSILVTAKHITFLIDRIPMNGFELKNATGQQAATAVEQAMWQNEPQIMLRSKWQEAGPRADIRVEKNTTVQDFIHNIWIPMYGGMLWRVKRQVDLREVRGGNTQVELAKYKNIRELNWAGNVDEVVTRAHVRAEIQKDWLLPPVTGAPLLETVVDQNARGILHIAIHDKEIGTAEYIDGRMRFAVYDARGNKIETFQTHDTESADRQAEQIAKWQEDLRKKREQLNKGGNEKWETEQRPKIVNAIAELEQKINTTDRGQVGRWLMHKMVTGTYTLVMESPPEGYIADFWPKRDIVVNTTDNTTVKWYLWKEGTEGVTAEPYLEKTVDSPLINKYPMVLDGFYTVRDPSIITQEALDVYAENIFTDTLTDHMQEDITIVPDDLVTLETFNIGSTALVYFEEEDLSLRVSCVAYEFDALKQEIVSYTFGKKRRLLGGVLGDVFRKFTDAMRMESIARTESATRSLNRGMQTLGSGLSQDLHTLSGELDFQVRSLRADVVDTNVLRAAYAEINEAVIEKASIDELTAVDAKIESLQAIAVTTEYLFTNYLEAREIRSQFASVGTLNAVTARIDTLEAGSITTEYLETNYLSAGEIQANYLTTTELNAKYATIQRINATDLIVDQLSATQANISNLLAGNLTAEHIQAGTITADSGLIATGAITTAMIQDAAITSAQLAEASVTDAHIVELTANKITAGTLSVERLEIRGSENSIVYQLNNITGALQAQNVDTLNGEIVTPRTITADKIVAKSITSNEIKAKSITANELVAGTITAASGVIASLDANKITTGTLSAARIATKSITADKLAADVGKSLDLSSNVSIVSTVNAKVDASMQAVSDLANANAEHVGDISKELEDLSNYAEETSSQVTQLHDSLSVDFTKREDFGNLSESHDNFYKEVHTNFTFSDQGLSIGRTDSDKGIVLSNEALEFKDGGVVVAKIDGQRMTIDELLIASGLTVGVHKLEKYSDTVTLIRYVGGLS